MDNHLSGNSRVLCPRIEGEFARLANKERTRRGVVRRHAEEDRGAAVAGGKRRAQSGADFDDGAGAQGKCLRSRLDQNRRNPCRGRLIRSMWRVGIRDPKRRVWRDRIAEAAS